MVWMFKDQQLPLLRKQSTAKWIIKSSWVAAERPPVHTLPPSSESTVDRLKSYLKRKKTWFDYQMWICWVYNIPSQLWASFIFRVNIITQTYLFFCSTKKKKKKSNLKREMWLITFTNIIHCYPLNFVICKT